MTWVCLKLSSALTVSQFINKILAGEFTESRTPHRVESDGSFNVSSLNPHSPTLPRNPPFVTWHLPTSPYGYQFLPQLLFELKRGKNGGKLCVAQHLFFLKYDSEIFFSSLYIWFTGGHWLEVENQGKAGVMGEEDEGGRKCWWIVRAAHAGNTESPLAVMAGSGTDLIWEDREQLKTVEGVELGTWWGIHRLKSFYFVYFLKKNVLLLSLLVSLSPSLDTLRTCISVFGVLLCHQNLHMYALLCSASYELH